MTASASSSSATSPPELARVDLLRAGLLPPLPSAFLGGNDLDLLEPLRFLPHEGLPPGRPTAVDRRRLAEALATANAAYGHPAAAELGRRLADPATRVVVAGQQPGLFGGPLYTLSKAVAAARWQERLEAAGEPAVAVFWVATEDHDYREVARSVFLTPDGPRELGLGDDPAPLMPLGMRTLGPRVEELLAELGAAVPGERFAAWAETLGRWYRPEARFGEAFCRLLTGLLGERCPLLLDAMLPAVKEAERPWMERLVERRLEVDKELAARESRIEHAGYALQVRPQPGASQLFLLHGRERRRIEWAARGRWKLRGVKEPPAKLDALLAVLEDNPGVVSPGALARPALQDAILGTSLLVLGPGELSYLPQAATVYSVLGVEPPWVVLRPQALVLEPHQRRKLDGLGIALEHLVVPELDLDRLLAGDHAGEVLDPLRREIDRALEEARGRALALDPGLDGPWQKTRGQVSRALDAFGGKVRAADARQHEVQRARAADLREAARPLGQAQERVISSAHFAGKYGAAFVEAFFDQLGLDPANLQVICP